MRILSIRLIKTFDGRPVKHATKVLDIEPTEIPGAGPGFMLTPRPTGAPEWVPSSNVDRVLFAAPAEAEAEAEKEKPAKKGGKKPADDAPSGPAA